MKQNNPGGVWWGCKTGKRGQNHPLSPFLAVPLTLPLLVRTEIATNSRVGTKFWLMAADSNRSRPQPAAI